MTAVEKLVVEFECRQGETECPNDYAYYERVLSDIREIHTGQTERVGSETS